MIDRWGWTEAMESSTSPAVAEFLDGLPPDRREALAVVRHVILANLPEGYQEIVDATSLSYCVPLERFPKTYNGRPLTIAALASRKTYISLFLMAIYRDGTLGEWFQEEYSKTGKKLEMGKACVRFRRADDLPLDLVGKVIGLVGMDRYVAFHEANYSNRKRAGAPAQ